MSTGTETGSQGLKHPSLTLERRNIAKRVVGLRRGIPHGSLSQHGNHYRFNVREGGEVELTHLATHHESDASYYRSDRISVSKDLSGGILFQSEQKTTRVDNHTGTEHVLEQGKTINPSVVLGRMASLVGEIESAARNTLRSGEIALPTTPVTKTAA